MPTPAPLDAAWTEPFLVRDALGAGVSEGRLRRKDLERRFRGARSPLGTPDVPAFLPLLRTDERFSHATAAALWGVPLPRRLDGQLHVTVGSDATRTRHPGVIGHRAGAVRSASREGVPVSTALDLIVELAAQLNLEELVAAIDHLILEPRVQAHGDPRPYADLAEIRRQLERRTGRHIRKARAAAELARAGAESRRETWLRLLALDAGLPEPECNAPIFDARGRIGWFDLVWERWRIASEYDGDQHRTSDMQYDRDITRFDRASAADWRVIRVRNDGYRNPDATRQRLLQAFRSRGWRPGL